MLFKIGSSRQIATMGSGNRYRRHLHRQWLLRTARRKFISSGYGPARSQSATRRVAATDVRSLAKDANQCIEILLPASMDFETHYEATATPLKMLRNACQQRIRIKHLRFDEITSISPAAALVLASEVDRWNQRVGQRLRARVGSWHEEIKRLLCEMGYFELLGLRKPAIPPRQSDFTFLNFIRGQSGGTDVGKLAKQLRLNIEAIVGNDIKKHALYEGLSEAITNVGQHAYPAIGFSGSKKQWWLSATFDKRSRVLTVIFYDQGAGIPKTLPASHMYESMKELFSSWKDSQKIEAAMRYGRTATARPERGKGLKNMVEFVRAHEEGKFSIYSHRGLYRIVHVQGRPDDITLRDVNISVGGTLLEWSVKL